MTATAPLVFQCSSCRAILSDSQELVCTLTAPGPQAAKCVVVRGMSDARVDRIAHTSVSSTGERATFFSLCCGSCGAVVGRTYTEAPAGVSHVQNLFCLEVSRCTSYELGSSEMRAAAAPQQQQLPADGHQQLHGSENNAVGPGIDSPLVLDLLQRLEHLEASLCTLQGIQVLHDAQLRTLPGYQAETVS